MSTKVGRPSSAQSRPGVGYHPKIRGKPMHAPSPMQLSPRCGAKTRSGSPCRSPAMPNGRCRMHGGNSPGALKGKANGNYKKGRYTCEVIEERRLPAAWVRATAQFVQEGS